MNFLSLIAHPHLLIVAAVLSLPVLWPFARFFFSDFDTFRRDLNWGDPLMLLLWWFGWPVYLYRQWWDDDGLDLRIFLFLACYAGVVAAVYQLLLKLAHY